MASDLDLPGQGEETKNAFVEPDQVDTGQTDEDMDAVLARIDPMGDAEKAELEETGGGEGLISDIMGEEAEVENKRGADPEESLEEGAKREGEEEGKEEHSELDNGELEKALAVLQRGQVPEEVVNELDPEVAIAWAAKLAPSQAAADDAFRRNGELQREIDGQSGSHEGESSKEEQPPAGVENPDLAEIIEQFGEDSAEKFADFVDSKMAASQERSNALESTLEKLIIDSATSEMKEDFPQLKDADSVKEMVEKATTLLGTGDYSGDVADAMKASLKDAANVLWGSSNLATRAAAMNQRRELKRQGQSSKPKGAAPKKKALTTDERETDALKALEAGATVDQARKAYG